MARPWLCIGIDAVKRSPNFLCCQFLTNLVRRRPAESFLGENSAYGEARLSILIRGTPTHFASTPARELSVCRAGLR